MFEQTIRLSQYVWANFVCIRLSELLASFTTRLNEHFLSVIPYLWTPNISSMSHIYCWASMLHVRIIEYLRSWINLNQFKLKPSLKFLHEDLQLRL